jgi:hypothetical protein
MLKRHFAAGLWQNKRDQKGKASETGSNGAHSTVWLISSRENSMQRGVNT